MCNLTKAKASSIKYASNKASWNWIKCLLHRKLFCALKYEIEQHVPCSTLSARDNKADIRQIEKRTTGSVLALRAG